MDFTFLWKINVNWSPTFLPVEWKTGLLSVVFKEFRLRGSKLFYVELTYRTDFLSSLTFSDNKLSKNFIITNNSIYGGGPQLPHLRKKKKIQ